MYSELCQKRELNTDMKETIDNHEEEISELIQKSKTFEAETREMSMKCQQLVSDKNDKLSHIKTLTKEIDEITDRLEEATLIIKRLKKNNDKKEKNINLMAQKADKLMAKYSEIKERAIKEKHNHFDNKNQLNISAGSRLMDYLLHKVYHRQIKQSMSVLQNFSQFDKDFFNSLKKISRIFEEKSDLRLSKVLQKWRENALNPSKIALIPSKLNEAIKGDKNTLEKTLKTRDNDLKQLRIMRLRKLAQKKFRKVFSSITSREQNRMFDCWKETCLSSKHREQVIRPLLENLRILVYKVPFKIWKEKTNERIKQLKLNFFVNEESKADYLQTIFNNLKAA